MQVLYIEDDPKAVQNIQRIIQSLGYDLRVATTLAEGIGLLDQHPDVIVTDSFLPDGEGIALIRHVRERDALTPIVAVSGYAVAGEPERYTQAGCTDYLVKPLHARVLIDLLKRYVR